MLGLGDSQIVAALAGCVLITLVGVAYGALNWNKGTDPRREMAILRRRRMVRNRKFHASGERRP